jgi:hypothetical protein
MSRRAQLLPRLIAGACLAAGTAFVFTPYITAAEKRVKQTKPVSASGRVTHKMGAVLVRTTTGSPRFGGNRLEVEIGSLEDLEDDNHPMSGGSRPLPSIAAKRMRLKFGVGETTLQTGALSSLVHKFDVVANANDPQIAAGFKYLAVTGYNKIWFFEKSGAPLPNLPLPMKTRELFYPLFAPDNPDNINHYINLPPGKSCDPTIDPWTTDPTLRLKVQYCLGDIYDTRVVFDPTRSRFWIVSAVRSTYAYGFKDTFNTDFDPACQRRKIVVAVSKTEDPRDGFYYYWYNMLVDDGICNSEDTNSPCPGSQYYPSDAADYPTIAVNERYFIEANTAGNRNADRDYSFINVLDADAMAKGSASVDSWSYWNIAAPDGSIVKGVVQPVIQHSPLPNGATMLVQNYKDSKTQQWYLLVMGFAPKSGSTYPALKTVRVPVAPYMDGVADGPMPGTKRKLRLNNMGSQLMRAAYRNNKLYVIGMDCWPAARPACITALRLIGKDVWDFLSLPSITTGPELDRTFGIRGKSDPADAVMYYGNPGVDINAKGDVVAVYMRTGDKVFPEARYSIYYHNEKDIRPSTLLHGGTLSLCYDTDDPKAPPYCGNMDTAGIAVDPTDDTAIWVAHYFANASPQGGYFAIGKVVP